MKRLFGVLILILAIILVLVLVKPDAGLSVNTSTGVVGDHSVLPSSPGTFGNDPRKRQAAKLLLHDTFRTPVTWTNPNNVKISSADTGQALFCRDNTGSYPHGSITSDKVLALTGGSSDYNSPNFYYSSDPTNKVTWTRTQGLGFRVKTTPVGGSNLNVHFGWDANQALYTDFGFKFGSAGAGWWSWQATAANLGYSFGNVATDGTTSQIMVVQQTTGFYYFTYGGYFTRPTLVYVERAGTGNMYPYIMNFNAPITINDMALINMTQFGSIWASQDGLATSKTASPVNGTTGTMTPDALVEVTWTPNASETGETMRLMVRYTDDDNYWCIQAVQGGGSNNVKLIKRAGGVEDSSFNVRGTLALTAGTAYRFIVVADGSNYDLHWGTSPNAGMQSSWKWSVHPITGIDLFNATATGVKVTIDKAGTLADLIAWPRYPAMPTTAWAPSVQSRNLVFAGDSMLTYGREMLPYTIGHTTPYPNWEQIAISGEKVVNFQANEGPAAALKYDPKAAKNWAIVWGGTNDCWSGSATPETVRTALWDFCDYLRGLGYQVCVVTMLQRRDPAYDHTQTTPINWAARETWRGQYNAYIVAEYASHADAIADFAAYAAANWPTYYCDGTTYLGDGIHLTTAKADVLAPMLLSAIAP